MILPYYVAYTAFRNEYKYYKNLKTTNFKIKKK